MQLRVTAVFVAAFALSLVYAGSAMAATQWVNDDPSIGTNTSCADPGFNQIQQMPLPEAGLTPKPTLLNLMLFVRMAFWKVELELA
jgi:hypothetical protein